MRRAVIVVIVIVGLLIVADRLAVVAADNAVAAKIETDQGLSQRPDVSIHGFPFLTQALRGRYGDVTLTLHDFHHTGVPVRTLTVDLRGVHVPIRAVMSQHLSRVPVDRASATILLSFSGLNSFLADKHVTVSAGADGRINVSGSVTVLGRTVTASGTGRIDVRGSDLVVTVGHGLDFTIPLGGLPFRIALVSAKATNAGIVVQATASGLVLHPGT
jgi:hypothetical protein